MLNVFGHVADLTIGMPLRAEAYGQIPASRAATISSPVVEHAAGELDYHVSPGVFCRQLVDEVLKQFRDDHKRLGA